jgi:acyl-CoA thioester hydrolase
MTEKKKTNSPRPHRKRAAAKPVPEREVSATRNGTSEAAPTQASNASRVLAAIPLHVRWRDLDAFNHVNNSSYLTFLEESRLQWLRTVPGEWFTEHAMPVMAAVELHYRKPIAWPAEIDVLLSCERLGNSSMTIGNRIVDRNDHACVYADGNVVMVWVDPATGASVPLPDAIRNACSSL